MGVEIVTIISCIDWRLHAVPGKGNLIGDFARERGVAYFPIMSAGGILDIVRPSKAGFDDHIFKNAEIAIGNGASRIFLLNHEDCHAYGIHSINEERKQHDSDLLEARYVLGKEFPGIPIASFMACLIGESKDSFSVYSHSDFINQYLK